MPDHSWVPISQEDNPTRRRQRTATVERDLALHATAQPCPGCSATSWLSGGTGCHCTTRHLGLQLASRCAANAAAALTPRRTA